MLTRYLPVLLFALLLSACGGGSGGSTATLPDAPPPPPPPPGQTGTAEINLLFMGNSHTGYNDLTQMVAAMVRAARPGKTVSAVQAPGWMFLEERITDTATLNLLRSQNWTFVVLQAQKYSSSGQFLYSTAEAEELIRLSRRQHAVPIMFPEWPRRGNPETGRIFDLHLSIVTKEPACLPPIPQSFDAAQARYPGLNLYDPDGNHSAPAGAFLASILISSTMTGLAPSALPEIPGFGIDAETQAKLRESAGEALRMSAARKYCPADPVLP